MHPRLVKMKEAELICFIPTCKFATLEIAQFKTDAHVNIRTAQLPIDWSAMILYHKCRDDKQISPLPQLAFIIRCFIAMSCVRKSR